MGDSEATINSLSSEKYLDTLKNTFVERSSQYTVKFPEISPSKYKPPKPVTQKTLRLIAPPNISPPGGLYLENCPQTQSKAKHKR